MERLLFEINSGKIFQYKVTSFVIEGDFYIFKDIQDGKERKLHKSMFRGSEVL